MTETTNNPTESEATDIIDNHDKEGYSVCKVVYNDDGPHDNTNIKTIILTE